MLRQGILHFRRHHGINLAANDFITLQVAQMLSQHFFGHTRNQLAQLSKSLGPVFKIKQDQRLPLAANDVGSELHRAIVLFHAILPWVGYQKVPTSEKDTIAYNRQLRPGISGLGTLRAPPFAGARLV